MGFKLSLLVFFFKNYFLRILFSFFHEFFFQEKIQVEKLYYILTTHFSFCYSFPRNTYLRKDYIFINFYSWFIQELFNEFFSKKKIIYSTTRENIDPILGFYLSLLVFFFKNYLLRILFSSFHDFLFQKKDYIFIYLSSFSKVFFENIIFLLFMISFSRKKIIYFLTSREI